MLKIDVNNSRELQAVILAIRRADTEIRKQIRQRSKSVVDAAWTQAVNEHANTRLEHRVLAGTARTTVSDQNVRLTSGALSKTLSGGLKVSDSWAAVEFGAKPGKKATYTQRSRKGNRYSVTRHTTRQLRPRNRKGYVVYPAAASIIPRIAALWVQTTVRTLAEAFEGK